MEIIDISYDLMDSPIYPGNPHPEFFVLSRISDGGGCNKSAVNTCVHNATHIDAPLHFLEGGTPIDEVSPELFIGPCKVIEVSEGPITGEFVNKRFPKKCERILIKGGGRAWFMDSSAEEAAELGIKLIGTDACSIGCSGNQLKPHKAFLSRGIPILEGLNLENVSPGDYFLCALPLKIGGAEAAPARAVLVKDYIFWSK